MIYVEYFLTCLCQPCKHLMLLLSFLVKTVLIKATSGCGFRLPFFLVVSFSLPSYLRTTIFENRFIIVNLHRNIWALLKWNQVMIIWLSSCEYRYSRRLICSFCCCCCCCCCYIFNLNLLAKCTTKPGEVLNKVLYREAPPQGPTPYPYPKPFWQKRRYLFYIPFIEKRYPFHIPF